MIPRKRYDLVLAIYPQSRGFAFVLCEGWLAPVDWGIHEARGANKNARCLNRINSLLELHMPDIILLQDMSGPEARRAPRIQQLNDRIAELAELRGVIVRKYSRAQVIEYFYRKANSRFKPLCPTCAETLDERRSQDRNFRGSRAGLDVFP